MSRVNAAARAVALEYEIILVDDGSPDRSLELAVEFAREQPNVVVIELSRNFGHHPAMLTGLAQARGERVFYIDSDLEEAPELLSRFAKTMDETGADVVFGVHKHELGSISRRISSKFFWWLFRKISSVEAERNICNIRLMSREYVNVLCELRERNVFLGGMFVWPGFRQISLLIERQIRRSRSTYSLRRRLALMTMSVVSFSVRPLQMIFAVGCMIATLSTIVALFFLVNWLFLSNVVSGFTSVIISIWFLGGLIIASLGTIGLYVGHVYTETKARPRTVVRRVHQFPGRENS